MSAKIEISRKLCPSCNKTFSLVPDFLEPGKKHSREVEENYVSALFLDDCTYRDVAWSEVDGEREDASASVSRACRAVKRAAEVAPELMLALQKKLLGSEVNEEYECEFKSSRVVGRAKTSGKVRRLEILRVLFLTLEKLVGVSRREICAAYRRLRLFIRFPTPHSMKQQLF